MEIPPALLKSFNTTLTELGSELALIALKDAGFGPFQPQASRGFSPRETQSIARALSYPEVKFDGDNQNGMSPVKLRMTSPSHRSVLGVPLRYHRRVCGVLVIGRKDITSFSEKDRRQLQNCAGELEAALAKSGIMASIPDLQSTGRRSLSESGPESPLEATATEALMAEVQSIIPYDRALLTRLEADSKLLVGFVSHTPGHFEWRQGQIFTLDGSAAGWVIRHKKARLDRDLASTQGRFLDYKELYKDKFKGALVVPLRKGPELIGTITLATKTPDLYHIDMARAASGVMEKVARFLPVMGPRPSTSESSQRIEKTGGSESSGASALALTGESFEAREMIIRQERQAAIRELTGFLEQEIKRTLTKTRLDLEDTLGDRALGDATPIGLLDRVEQACRDLTRIETILNEILDNAKPLDLRRRVIRVQDVIESAVGIVTEEIAEHHIRITRDLSPLLPTIRADEDKLQQVFLSILKNALEAMTPGGHIHIEAVPHRGMRGRHEAAITIQNDGAPIPTEHIGKIFEPGFTTKAAGTGLGLPSVKKIVEEHRGQISIASGPGQGTTVIIRFPGHGPSRMAGRGRRRRPRRR